MHISVVIPTHNEELYIDACLYSLTHQHVAPDEIIIVDNNCTDCTIQKVLKYPVRIVQEPTQGMVFARNAGFNAAESEIIARCDADTTVPYDWINHIKEAFASYPIDALSGPLYFRDLPEHSYNISLMYAKLMKKIQRHETLFGPNLAITKKIWHKVRDEVCLDEKKIHEDIDLAIHIKKYGKIMFDPSLFVHTSSRRMKNNPLSFFVEYPLRLLNTLRAHSSLAEEIEKLQLFM